jgi:hypothetical protein
MTAILRVVPNEGNASRVPGQSSVPPLDCHYIDQTRNAVERCAITEEEALRLVRDYHRSKILNEHIIPERAGLLEAKHEAVVKLPQKKDELKALKRQREKLAPKIERPEKAVLVEKIPWEFYKVIFCAIFALASISLMVWAVVNTRNMAISSFPVFAANPDIAWGIGGVIALLALSLEMTPEFFGLKDGGRKAYDGSLGVVTAVSAVTWVVLFSKQAGLIGHGAGISTSLESILAPEASFLGLSPQQQDLLLTIAQFCLEFLLPTLGLGYSYKLFKAHGRHLPPVSLEENPEYLNITREIAGLEEVVGDLKNQIMAPDRFEKKVEHQINQYVLKAEAYLWG